MDILAGKDHIAYNMIAPVNKTKLSLHGISEQSHHDQWAAKALTSLCTCTHAHAQTYHSLCFLHTWHRDVDEG